MGESKPVPSSLNCRILTMCCLPHCCSTAALISYLSSIKLLLPHILSLLQSIHLPPQDDALSVGERGVLVKLFVVVKVCLSSSVLLCINFELILSVVTIHTTGWTEPWKSLQQPDRITLMYCYCKYRKEITHIDILSGDCISPVISISQSQQSNTEERLERLRTWSDNDDESLFDDLDTHQLQPLHPHGSSPDRISPRN